jgi:hypothetical protein
MNREKAGVSTAYNRAYLTTVLRTSAQIPRLWARNFRYAQLLYEMAHLLIVV